MGKMFVGTNCIDKISSCITSLNSLCLLMAPGSRQVLLYQCLAFLLEAVEVLALE